MDLCRNGELTGAPPGDGIRRGNRLRCHARFELISQQGSRLLSLSQTPGKWAIFAAAIALGLYSSGASAQVTAYPAPCAGSVINTSKVIGPVKNLHVIPGAQSVTIHWCPPSQGASRVRRYLLVGSDGQRQTVEVPNTWAIVDGLRNGQPVDFKVRAESRTSHGPWVHSSLAIPEPLKPPAHVVTGKQCSVGFDHYSLKICGRRVFVYSGEFHPWRLPSPSLWLDRLEKMKAAGFNSVTFYFNWAYHSPDPGTYNFTGIRNVNRLLNDAQRVGLYVIARVGPYINAEANAGGFPGWLTTERGKARTTAPDYTRAWKQWYSEINAIVAAHQVTRGGDVILYQIENELGAHNPDTEVYMQTLAHVARTDGINVPIFTQYVVWAKGKGAPDLFGLDLYPLRFDCARRRFFPNPPDPAAEHSVGGPHKPLFLSEYQGGGFDGWGGSGYAACYRMTGPAFENTFYDENLAAGATLMSFYMTVGGTSWGWIGDPHVYTSYDYGAAIRESGEIGSPSNPNLEAGSKYGQQKLIAYFTQTVHPLTKTTREEAPRATNPSVRVIARRNPITGTQFIYLRHRVAATGSTVYTHLSLETPQGRFLIPQKRGSAISIPGKHANLLVANYRFDGQDMVYSTSQIMLRTVIGATTYLLLYGPDGSSGETVFHEPSTPHVKIITGNVGISWSKTRHLLRLDYVQSGQTHGLQQVQIRRRGAKPLELLIMPRRVAESFWLADTRVGHILLEGGYVLRAAEFGKAGAINGSIGHEGVGALPSALTGFGQPHNGVLNLTGDTVSATTLRIYAPRRVRRVSWDGKVLRMHRGRAGALIAKVSGVKPFSIPALKHWQFRTGAPETHYKFNDASWAVADHPCTTNPHVPTTTPVLYADDYGFHYGFVWYRGRFAWRAGLRGVKLVGDGGGPTGAFSVWLNGVFIGSNSAGGRETEVFRFPIGLLHRHQENEISVLVLDSAHDEDGASNDAQKRPRGLLAASLVGSRSGPQEVIHWRLTGAKPWRTPEGTMDQVGLYGSAHGWIGAHVNPKKWKAVRLPDRWVARGIHPGIGWYRTSFHLQVPRGVYAPIGLRIGGPGPGVGPRRYQALIFVNGWFIGRYVNYLGPQHTFYVPAGVLRGDAENTVAIAVWGIGHDDGGLARVKLVHMGLQRGGLPVARQASKPG